MAISKTNFINYTKCDRYSALEDIRKDKLLSKMSIEEYKKEEENEQIKELVGSMFETEEDSEEDIDLTRKEDPQLNTMLEYYKEVELETGYFVTKHFLGETVFSEDTYSQESFDFVENGIRYICYVDIFNKNNDEINIIEVKATTSKNYLDMMYGSRGGEKFPLFIKKGFYYELSNCVNTDEPVLKNYLEKIEKLKNRYSNIGKYIYDLAVQRYIIEHDFLSHNKKTKVNYYLSVLNSNYVYDGYLENEKRVYRTDKNGNDIVCLFKLNEVTESMQERINLERLHLEDNLFNPKLNPCQVGVWCNLKKNTECPYKMICFKNLPCKNTSFNYLNFRAFTDEQGNKYDKYDLINNGYYKMDDVPYNWLINPNHIIQRNCYDNNEVYADTNKINAFLNDIEYPIYHLDFETFPCPMPRFRGETPYTQSCFEFSLHIERAPGICDKDKDNFVFLCHSNKDERLELVKALVEHIDVKCGTMLAQNVGFEMGRLKELSEVFPEYQEHLLKIRNMGYDLLYIIRNNKSIATKLGFENTASIINYYNASQSGSYSIKKTLPLFTNLKYSDLEVQNGVEALVEYSKFDKMDKMTLEKTRNNLIQYCQQDTWAMVEILRGLRKLVSKK